MSPLKNQAPTPASTELGGMNAAKTSPETSLALDRPRTPRVLDENATGWRRTTLPSERRMRSAVGDFAKSG